MNDINFENTRRAFCKLCRSIKIRETSRKRFLSSRPCIHNSSSCRAPSTPHPFDIVRPSCGYLLLTHIRVCSRTSVVLLPRFLCFPTRYIIEVAFSPPVHPPTTAGTIAARTCSFCVRRHSYPLSAIMSVPPSFAFFRRGRAFLDLHERGRESENVTRGRKRKNIVCKIESELYRSNF